ncbi:MAG: hypothetical protein ACOCUI_05515, partial [bacterium]
CLGLSFFAKSKIDYSYARIILTKKEIEIYQVNNPQVQKPWFNLFPFSINWNLHEFLKYNWVASALKNKQKLDVAINKFLQSQIVDGRSRFLLLYNVIEMCKSNNKKVSEKFVLAVKEDKKKEIFDSALEILLKAISKDEHEEFEKKWNSICKNIDFKPHQGVLKEYLESIGVDVSKKSKDLEKAIQMRNNITHGSIKKVKEAELISLNKMLWKLAGISILELLGIKEWKLDVKD